MLLTGAVTILAAGSSVQLVVAFLIVLFNMLLILKLGPFIDDADDYLSFLCSLQMLLTLLGGILIKTDNSLDPSYDESFMGPLLVMINSLSFFALALSLIMLHPKVRKIIADKQKNNSTTRKSKVVPVSAKETTESPAPTIPAPLATPPTTAVSMKTAQTPFWSSSLPISDTSSLNGNNHTPGSCPAGCVFDVEVVLDPARGMCTQFDRVKFSKVDGSWAVICFCAGTSAKAGPLESAGVNVGDRLSAIDAKALADFAIPDLQSVIGGAKQSGKTVVFSFIKAAKRAKSSPKRRQSWRRNVPSSAALAAAEEEEEEEEARKKKPAGEETVDLDKVRSWDDW
jgi:hypothetical protein